MMRKMIFTILALIGTLSILSAQQMPTPVPADPDVKVGVLENGLTYYIRHNPKPENQAEFYIAHNVGAIQEEDSQIGLAHFLEHMAFNGTKNLPGKMLIDYLETVGVKFGVNLNAGTGQETTIYNMSSVPLTREGIVDTALLILHDWSYYIALEPDEIDSERGVIIEELRTRNNANWRIIEKSFPILFGDSRYAHRNVIGTEEQLRNFPHQELVDFYHRWYRTDQQAIIIVGDFDADQMEQKVINLMSSIPAVENPEPKVMHQIPGSDEPRIGIFTDPELTSSAVSLYIKQEQIPYQYRDTYDAYFLDVVKAFMGRMAGYRLQEIAQQPNSPFLNAGINYSGFTQTTDVLAANASAHNGQTARAFEALYTELERIRRFGFTPSEFERAQTELYRSAEKDYDASHDRRSDQYVRRYINNFIYNMPMPDARTEWEMDSLMVNVMELNIVNALAAQWITPENRMIIITAPEKEGSEVPTSDDILALMERIDNQELEPYQDDTVYEPLIDSELPGSPVVKTETDRYGATVWTLGNGVRVKALPTDYKNDEVIMTAISKGGLSVLDTEDIFNGNYLSSLLSLSGVGKFNAVELRKQLTGKMAGVGLGVTNNYNNLGGSASTKDLETLLQLAYLNLTAPRFEQEGYDMLMERLRSALANNEGDPQFILQDVLLNTLYDSNPRRQMLKTQDLEKITLEGMREVYDKLYGSPDNFEYMFVGDFDPETLRPLVEKYLGSLPADNTKYTWQDDGVRMVKKDVTNRFTVPMQMPKTTVVNIFTGDLEYSVENDFYLDALSDILDIRYIESIREEKGGTYGVSVRAGLSYFPDHTYSLQIRFDTDPNMVNELLEIVKEEIAEIARSGPRAEDLAKVTEYLVKKRPDDLRKNNTWLSFLIADYLTGTDNYREYDTVLGSVDPAKVQAMAARILEDDNEIMILMMPEE